MYVISPGHWHVGTGARGFIDEVEEARKVVREISNIWSTSKIAHKIVVDNQSKNVSQNLSFLIREHKKYHLARHISIHFNSVAGVHDRPIGCEVLYAHDSMKHVAEQVSNAIHLASGLKNRGAKKHVNLRWLNAFSKSGILVEVCFVNSKKDVELYSLYFHEICKAIACSVLK